MSSFFCVCLLSLVCLLACDALPLWTKDLNILRARPSADEIERYERSPTSEISIRDDSNSSTNGSSSDSLSDCDIAGLCPEGIANIVAGLSAIGFLGVLACILWNWEVQAERKARIRLALERNRTIERQMEEEKKKREERVEKFIAKSKSKEENLTVGGGNQGDVPPSSSPASDPSQQLLVERRLVEQELTSDSELSSDERRELLSVKSKTYSEKVKVTAEVTS